MLRLYINTAYYYYYYCHYILLLLLIRRGSDYTVGLVTTTIGLNISKKRTGLIASAHNLRGKV